MRSACHWLRQWASLAGAFDPGCRPPEAGYSGECEPSSSFGRRNSDLLCPEPDPKRLTQSGHAEQFGMTDSVLLSSTGARLVIIPITTVALLLPLSTCCSACTRDDDQLAAPDGCCQSHATEAVADDLLCFSPHASHCSCCIQPTDRTSPQPDRLSPRIELSSALPPATDVGCDCDVSLVSDLLRRADTATPVPHCILHCSWQI